MILTLDTGQKKDLTSAQIKALDTKLRSRLPKLIAWSYSPRTGFLTLDFGEADEDDLEAKLRDIETRAEAKLRRLELWEMTKTWRG